MSAGNVSAPKKRRILPPVWVLLSLVAMALLHRYLPLWRFTAPWLAIAGVVLGVAGLAMAAISAGAFRRAGTPVIPFEPSKVLVTGGFYRYTRNPMYLGMVLLQLGVALWLGSAATLLPIVAFVAIIRWNFIAGEERFLEGIFGEPYRAYMQRVRRWF
jgi:protein-S-isoprenylcysteine O-methyltransferase Ste14